MPLERVREEIDERLSPVIDAHPLSGGDINEAYRVRLEDGRQIFVKTNEEPPATMFPMEAEGLRWLGETEALRVPNVLAVSEDFLALELITPGAPAPDHAEQLGRGLAALHRYPADGYGWRHPNFIGSLPQDNSPRPTWSSFYAENRLEAQLKMAVDRGRASDAIVRGMKALMSRIDGLVGADEPPSRLHGDLWGGNCHTDRDGAPVLIDPAVYGGHREMDLAMMHLFGGFSSRTFDAYAEAWPLSAGAAQRVPLYQLYPLMVHVNLFGGSYIRSVERALGRLV